jgi:hypothetical protein
MGEKRSNATGNSKKMAPNLALMVHESKEQEFFLQKITSLLIFWVIIAAYFDFFQDFNFFWLN